MTGAFDATSPRRGVRAHCPSPGATPSRRISGEVAWNDHGPGTSIAYPSIHPYNMLTRPFTVLLICLLGAPGPSAHAAEKMRPSKGKGVQPEVIYHNYCSVCHGDKGDGQSRAQRSLNPPPRNFTTPEAANELTRKKMIEVVTHGKPDTAMAAWKTQLSPQEIEAVVDYIRRNFMLAAADPGAEAGRTIYARTCSVCHGDKGNGQTWAAANMSKPPRDFTAPQTIATLTRAKMIAAVTHGRPDTAMPGFASQLPAKDIEAVVDYIRTAFMQPASSTAGISGTYAHGLPGVREQKAEAKPEPARAAINMQAAMPKGLAGNYDKGEGFYKNNCATCHGELGDGRGPRAYFINPKPRNFLHAASKSELNRPALFKRISEGVLGTEMPAWNKVLNDQQIADVTEYVYRKFISGS